MLVKYFFEEIKLYIYFPLSLVEISIVVLHNSNVIFVKLFKYSCLDSNFLNLNLPLNKKNIETIGKAEYK